MKKIILPILFVIICVVLVGCSSAIAECEEAIEAVGTLDPAYSASSGIFKIDQDGIERFEKADVLYNQLSEKQQKKVKNISLLEDQRDTYNELVEVLPYLRMYSYIYFRAEKEAEMEAKYSCDNPSSFKLVNATTLLVYGSDDYESRVNQLTGDFCVDCLVSYSETNYFGGPRDGSVVVEVSGKYNFEEETIGKCDRKIKLR